MMKLNTGKLETACGQERKNARCTPFSGLERSSSSEGHMKRRFGSRRAQQRQLVNDSNREIAHFLSAAGFTCRAMNRGVDKALVCLRKTRQTRDE